MHQLLMNLHPLHVQFMQQTKHNAKSVWHEAATKQQFKEFYSAFCFDPIERKNEKVQAERQHLGSLLRSRAKKILPSDGRRWISFSNNPMPTCIDTQSATKKREKALFPPFEVSKMSERPFCHRLQVTKQFYSSTSQNKSE